MSIFRRLLCLLLLAGLLGSAAVPASAAPDHVLPAAAGLTDHEGCGDTNSDAAMICQDACDDAGVAAMDCLDCAGAHACAAVIARGAALHHPTHRKSAYADLRQHAIGCPTFPSFTPPRTFG